MPVVLKSRGQGSCGEIDPGCGRENPNMELLEFTAPKDHAKTDDDEKRKGKIPTKGGTVAKKFGVSGLKDGPHSLQVHGILY